MRERILYFWRLGGQMAIEEKTEFIVLGRAGVALSTFCVSATACTLFLGSWGCGGVALESDGN